MTHIPPVMTRPQLERALETREQKFVSGRRDRMFISRALIKSKAFAALKTPTSYRVYLIFLTKCAWTRAVTRPYSREKDWVIANNHEIEFTYIEAWEKYGISEGKFKRAIADLVRVGLLDVAQSGFGLHRVKSLYTISDRWRLYGTTEFVKAERTKRQERLGFRKGNRHGRNCECE